MAKTNNQNHAKPSGGFGTGFLVATVIFLVIVVLAGLIWGGWWYYKKHIKSKFQQMGQEMQSRVAETGQPQSSATKYVNSQFGFSVAITPAWKDYKTTEETMGGDFEVGRIGFYLPTVQKGWESSSMPGYFNAFAISAYVRDSWDEAVRAGSSALPMGEEIGRNNYYVFVWSHFNGDPPSDVSEQAILDMQTIVDSIEVFNSGDGTTTSSSGDYSAAVSSSASGNWAAGTKPVRDGDFDYDSVYYWNCKHGYTLNYPTAWSNNGMTFNSDTVILKGNKVQVWVEAVAIPASKTLQEFAEERAAQVSSGVRAWDETVDWGNGTTVFRSTFTKSDSQALWWISNSGYGMELKTVGDGYNSSYTTIQNLIATLDPNSAYIGEKCGTSGSSGATKKSVAPAPKSSDCSFPNGDIEFWWDTVSQSTRDCYISKYGYPSF